MDERTESPQEIIEHVSWCKNFLRANSGYFFLFPEPSTIIGICQTSKFQNVWDWPNKLLKANVHSSCLF